MNINVRAERLAAETCDAIVVGRYADGSFDTTGQRLDKAMGGLLRTVTDEDGFSGKVGAGAWVRTNGSIPTPRVLVIGLGERKTASTETARVASAAAFNAAKALGLRRVVSVLFDGNGVLSPRQAAVAMVEGIRLADYQFGRYKTEEGKASPEAFDLVLSDAKRLRAAREGAAAGELNARGTAFARDLVNTPAQHMRPEDLVAAARSVAAAKSPGTGSVRIRVYGREQLERMGAGGLLGIGQGSEHEPFLVHMIYAPKTTKKAKKIKRVALVGKAVTFDSGGLSLKPAGSMETMKCDMAGAAAVLGTFSIIREIAPNAEVHGLFGAVENMPSGRAIRPGDVVTIMNGKTIEIRNTDAEGRVTLADVLSYAVRQKPDAIIDLATLTGACVVALGEEITGLMSNDDALAGRVLNASAAAGERMWRLPLPDEYRELIKTDIADFKNDAPRWGGTLTAGLLLQEFVGGIPWVHLDIAGPAFAEKPVNGYTKKGATGHGVRTLAEYLRSL